MKLVGARPEYQEWIRLADRRLRRAWLERQWSGHLKRKALRAGYQNS